MIVKKINRIDNYEYDTKIPIVSVDYLKEIQNFFSRNNILDELYDKSFIINDLLSKIENIDIFIKVINQITIYNDGISSSKIENISLVNKNNLLTPVENSTQKIYSYINEVNKINCNGGLINEALLVNFHDNIEKDKIKGIRMNTPQYIGNHRAPNGEYLRNALDNFWDIYFGNNKYDDIDQFIRWAYQHLLFEIIHPFDDGNGRSGRMLNFFFFKNQKSRLFDDFLFETSSNIFESKQDYAKYLNDSRVICNSTVYSSEYKKSLSRDCCFCRYMFDRLLERMNWIIDNVNRIKNNIDYTKNAFANNKVLKKYSEKLLDFFSTYPVFNRTLFVNYLDISETTASKVLTEIVRMGLIDNDQKGIKNLQYKRFIIFSDFN